jgi:hypothetical protein
MPGDAQGQGDGGVQEEAAPPRVGGEEGVQRATEVLAA